MAAECPHKFVHEISLESLSIIEHVTVEIHGSRVSFEMHVFQEPTREQPKAAHNGNGMVCRQVSHLVSLPKEHGMSFVVLGE